MLFGNCTFEIVVKTTQINPLYPLTSTTSTIYHINQHICWKCGDNWRWLKTWKLAGWSKQTVTIASKRCKYFIGFVGNCVTVNKNIDERSFHEVLSNGFIINVPDVSSGITGKAMNLMEFVRLLIRKATRPTISGLFHVGDGLLRSRRYLVYVISFTIVYVAEK